MAITNLTGTKWTIETMNCVADYGVFELEGWVIETNSTLELRRLYIGWDMDEDGVPNLKVPNYFLYEFENGYSRWHGGYIEITGGTDATNARLISWLEENGTLIPPTPPSIADKLLTVNQIKQDIKVAIENKGVDLTSVDFGGYAEKIDTLPAVVELTQAQYDALPAYDNNTYYLIVEE